MEQFWDGKQLASDKKYLKQLTTKIKEYVMINLHPVMFGTSTDQDTQLKQKADGLQWVTPEQFGVPNAKAVYKPSLWKKAIEKLKLIKYQCLPGEKQRSITFAICII